MQVKSSEAMNGRYVCLYGLFAFLYLLAILLPIRWFPAWPMIVGTFVFIAVILFSLRAWFQAAIALSPPPSPPPLPDELPTVSIVIPSFNEERVLPRTIPTVLALDYPPDKLEFIYLYESACTDRTEQIVLDFAAQDPRIKPVRRPTTNGGKAAATNYALRFATGRIIGIFDADHSLAPDLVRRAVAHLQSPSAGCVRGRCRSINHNLNLLTRLVTLERDAIERLGIYSEFRYGGFANFGGGHGFFRRDIFDQLGLFDEDVLTEDVEFSVKLHLAGLNVVVDPAMQSFEEAPPTLCAWFHQRKRWARGWMQIARFKMATILAAPIPLIKKFDMIVGLLSSLAPGLLITLFPVLILTILGFRTSCFSPWLSFILWLFVTSTPPLLALLTNGLDRTNKPAGCVSLILSPLLIPYLLVMFAVSWLAFVDEFLIARDSAYVKTERTHFVMENIN